MIRHILALVALCISFCVVNSPLNTVSAQSQLSAIERTEQSRQQLEESRQKLAEAEFEWRSTQRLMRLVVYLSTFAALLCMFYSIVSYVSHAYARHEVMAHLAQAGSYATYACEEQWEAKLQKLKYDVVWFWKCCLNLAHFALLFFTPLLVSLFIKAT